MRRLVPAGLASGRALRPRPARDAHWREADLSVARAEAVELVDCVLERVEPAGAELPRLALTGVRLADCSLANAFILRADLVRVDLRGCRLTGLELPEASGRLVRFTDCRADLASLRFARFEHTVFTRTSLAQADLSQADLREVSFVECDLTGADLSGARLEAATFDGCRLADLRGIGSLRGARMRWVDVIGLAGALAAEIGIELLDDEDRA